MKEIVAQLGVISKVVTNFKDSLPRPRSPPNYEEVENEGPKFTYLKASQSSSSLSLKAISEEIVDPQTFTKIVNGANLAKEKIELIKSKLERFKVHEIKMAGQEDTGESSTKHKRNESFSFSHKAP